jgi:hypothetical protein
MVQHAMYLLVIAFVKKDGKESIVEKECVLKIDLVNIVLKNVNVMKIIQKCVIHTMENVRVKQDGAQLHAIVLVRSLNMEKIVL